MLTAEPWTREDTKDLRRRYGSTPNRTLAKDFGRTIEAVEHKARKLRLHKSKEYLRSLGKK